MNVHAVQYSPVWQDRAANRQRIQTLLHAAPPTPGSLLVLPEMALTGFNLHPSQTLPDWQTDLEFFQHLAREHRCAVIAGGVRPTASPSPTPAENVAWVILPDGEVKATYVKQRPFSLGEEHRVHVAGTASIVVEYGGFRLAPQICYDLRFPE
ncbi:MAG: carbon-nitrogen family hydrolase, partial [Verrucomicrobiales bacterium]|nr:carbon-nitrogen family hydrolase [Verrucomicrobiales bacterium]